MGGSKDVHGQAGEVAQTREAVEHGWAELEGIEADLEGGKVGYAGEEAIQIVVVDPRGAVVHLEG